MLRNPRAPRPPRSEGRPFPVASTRARKNTSDKPAYTFNANWPQSPEEVIDVKQTWTCSDHILMDTLGPLNFTYDSGDGYLNHFTDISTPHGPLHVELKEANSDIELFYKDWPYDLQANVDNPFGKKVVETSSSPMQIGEQTIRRKAGAIRNPEKDKTPYFQLDAKSHNELDWGKVLIPLYANKNGKYRVIVKHFDGTGTEGDPNSGCQYRHLEIDFDAQDAKEILNNTVTEWLQTPVGGRMNEFVSIYQQIAEETGKPGLPKNVQLNPRRRNMFRRRGR